MSLTILCGICRGGPLDGQSYKQTTSPPTRSGLFDYEGLGGVRGRYTFRSTVIGGEWRWEAAASPTKPAGDDPTPIDPQPWGPYCLIGWPRGVVIPTPYHPNDIYGLLTTTTLPAPHAAPPASGAEARSAGITDDAGSAAADATRDS